MTEDQPTSPLDALTPVSQEEITRCMEKAAEEAKKYNEDLRSRAREHDDLITPVECTIDSVVGRTTTMSHSTRSEMVMGGRSSRYTTGHMSYLEMEVQTSVGIRELKVQGMLPLQKGDTIRAYVLKGEKVAEKNGIGLTRRESWECKEVYHWVERDFKSQEEATKIEKLVNGDVVATYI